MLGRRSRRDHVVRRPRGQRRLLGRRFAAPVEQGASIHGDDQSARLHHIEAATRFAPLEVWEQKNPWLMERCELAMDSGGPGKHRGGLGPDMAFHMLEATFTSRRSSERRTRCGGSTAGCPAAPTRGRLDCPTGRSSPVAAKGDGALAAEGLDLHDSLRRWRLRLAFRAGPRGRAQRRSRGLRERGAARRDYPHAFDP